MFQANVVAKHLAPFLKLASLERVFKDLLLGEAQEQDTTPTKQPIFRPISISKTILKLSFKINYRNRTISLKA